MSPGQPKFPFTGGRINKVAFDGRFTTTMKGQAAGCGRVIGITSGSHTREALAVHPHTHLVDRLREVLSICA